MADLGYVTTTLRGIKDDDTKRVLMTIFTHILQSGLTIGEPKHQARSKNLAATYLNSTTASSTGEFSIVHGLDSVPQFAVPMIDLRQAGAQFVPLEVSKAADSKRVYLKSTSPGAAFTLLVG